MKDRLVALGYRLFYCTQYKVHEGYCLNCGKEMK